MTGHCDIPGGCGQPLPPLGAAYFTIVYLSKADVENNRGNLKALVDIKASLLRATMVDVLISHGEKIDSMDLDAHEC